MSSYLLSGHKGQSHLARHRIAQDQRVMSIECALDLYSTCLYHVYHALSVSVLEMVLDN